MCFKGEIIMYLIVGLGNPESDYSKTRHNMGFNVINKLSEKYGIEVNKTKFKGLVGNGMIEGEKVILLKPQTFINMGFLQTIKAGFSYLFSCAHKREEDSLENFYINRFGKVLYSMFFESYTEKLWGRHPRYIAADWGSQRVKGLSIIEILKDMVAK